MITSRPCASRRKNGDLWAIRDRRGPRVVGRGAALPEGVRPGGAPRWPATPSCGSRDVCGQGRRRRTDRPGGDVPGRLRGPVRPLVIQPAGRPVHPGGDRAAPPGARPTPVRTEVRVKLLSATNGSKVWKLDEGLRVAPSRPADGRPEGPAGAVLRQRVTGVPGPRAAVARTCLVFWGEHPPDRGAAAGDRAGQDRPVGDVDRDARRMSLVIGGLAAVFWATVVKLPPYKILADGSAVHHRAWASPRLSPPTCGS